MLKALVELMTQALEGLASLPWGVHGIAALVMALGLLLWGAGQKVLKPIVVMLCGLTGAAAGFFILPYIWITSSIPLYQGMLIGFGAGALVGLLLFRSAMALGCGLVFGTLAPLTAAALLQSGFITVPEHTDSTAAGGVSPAAEFVQSAATEGARLGDQLSEHISAARQRVAQAANDAAAGARAGELLAGALTKPLPTARIIAASWDAHADDKSPPAPAAPETAPSATPDTQPDQANFNEHAERIRTVVSDTSSKLGEAWRTLPTAHQGIIVLATVCGAALGVVIGLIIPSWASVACTSLFGAGLWLGSLVWLSNAFALPWRNALDHGPGAWVIIWAVTAILGMAVQRRGLLSRKKSSDESDD